MNENIYLPYLMRIADVRDEAPAVKTFRLEFVDEAAGQRFDFKTGQFGLYSAFGEGESTFCIASSPTRKGYIECTFREAGRVTAALADKSVGDIVGFRGPYGNVFPLEDWKGKNLIFVAGGIALPPLRSVIWNCLDLRDWFKDITVVYGARSTSSWSCPIEFWPLVDSTPITVIGILRTRIIWSTGSCSPNSSRATVLPIQATLAEPASSAASNRRPLAKGQSRASR